MATSKLTIRLAEESDRAAIEEMHRCSVLELNRYDYTAAQIDAFIGYFGTYDPRMIGDGTYFVAECDGRLVGTGGWSVRTLQFTDPTSSDASTAKLVLSPSSAKMRSFFVHPDYARRGIASAVVTHVEAEAVRAGFTSFELVATPTGVPLYRRLGYCTVREIPLMTPDGLGVPAVHMVKLFAWAEGDSDAA